MRKKKQELKSNQITGSEFVRGVRALFTVFGDGATVVPCFWLRCLPSGTNFDPTQHILQVRKRGHCHSFAAALQCPLVGVGALRLAAIDQGVQ